MAAGFSGGGGYPGVTPSNVIRGKTRRDPNWELQNISEEQTSVYTESIPYRILTAVGYLKPSRGSDDVSSVEFWSRTGNTYGEVELLFYFEDVDIQNCYGIKVKSIMLEAYSGAVTTKAKRTVPLDGELCGDVVDDEISGDMRLYDFTGGKSRIKIRERISGTVHTIDVFDNNGYENGYYSVEELLIALKTKLKTYLDNRFSPNTINVEIFVDPNDGRLVIAWSGVNIHAITGGFDIDLNAVTSPFFAIIRRYFVYDKFKRNAYTYGSVSDGDGVSFLRSVRANTGGDSTVGNTNTIGVAISPELTQFQKSDSITPIAASGEIATFAMVEVSNSLGDQGGGYATWFSAEEKGTLNSPKVDFDPNYTLSSFTVLVNVSSVNKYLKTVASNLATIGTIREDAEQRFHCIITAILY